MNEPEEPGLTDDSVGVPEWIRNWKAKDWPEIKRVWKELVPEYYGDPSDPAPIRRFKNTVVNRSQGGYVFERWVMEAFRLAGYDTEPGWVVPGLNDAQAREQIDGLVLEGWQAFLVESKFRKENLDFTPFALLQARLNRRPPGCMGLLFSAFDFTKPCLESVRLHQPLRVLLFNGYNLTRGAKSKAAWGDMFKRTWVQAVKYSNPLLT